MPRPAWSLHAYQLIEPDEQLDLFACREIRLHLVARQFELAGYADRTLCGGLLPAQPRWLAVDRLRLRDRRLCITCHGILQAQRRGERAGWPAP
ncbi:MAG: hypothetical protein ABWY06_04915 [Pseudomonas sp.]|uniref:hypothetical protein n=1 Tax=Pseudomonas sp. TaxID=306 RepID=UPI003396A9C5